jgi:hypothetical protein
MFPTPPPPGPADDARSVGSAKLWIGPRGLTGAQVRFAMRCRLSLWRRLAVVAVMVGLAVGAGGIVLGLGLDWLIPVTTVASVLVALRLQLGWMKGFRRQCGLVQVTPLQFDLVIAMEQLPAQRVDEGRHLHDALVWHLQQPRPDRGAVAAIEQHMHHLATTAWAVAA